MADATHGGALPGDRPGGPKGRLGTFIGVFTPSILTILGVILYLRTGWLVGNVGLPRALGIVIVANLITFATALSIAAVATNMRVGAGGAYFIISRSLGIEIGGAIGIPLFLAQTFSVTLYAFGLAESLGLVWPGVPVRLVAVVTILAVSLLAARSADLALKAQLPIMGAIALSLVVLVIGAIRGAMAGGVPAPEAAAPLANIDTWTAFAVFFPAVTGIMAGVAMSGDLATPHVSIPRGTIAAVVVGFVVYLVVPVILSYAADPAVLATDNLVWFHITGPLWLLILPGLWGAIFSSAVGSILGAPRTLQALVSDRVVPNFLGRDTFSGRAMSIALVVSAGVALAAVGLGRLDAVAPVLTMFFLTTYGMVNLVAGLEQLSGDPSYRPTLRVPWWISLGGAAGCFWVMFLINRWACLLAIAIEIGLWLLMRRRAVSAGWGDLRRGALVALVRATVVRLRRLPEDARNWRPHILVFAGDVMRRADLVRNASWLVQDRGILTVSELIVGDLDDYADGLRRRTDELNTSLEAMGVTAFAEVDVVPEFESGAITVAQANGIAGIQSNTVMFGWSDKPERLASTLRIIDRLSRVGMSAVLCRPRAPAFAFGPRTIHAWWGGLQNNGDLILIFAHLLSLNREWRGARISVNSIATTEMMAERSRIELERMIRDVRIDAESEVIRKPPDTGVRQLIREKSARADLVIMGLRAVERGEEEEYAARLRELVTGLPTVLLVRNAGRFAGELLQADAPQPVP